jgi:hypothetical protein
MGWQTQFSFSGAHTCSAPPEQQRALPSSPPFHQLMIDYQAGTAFLMDINAMNFGLMLYPHLRRQALPAQCTSLADQTQPSCKNRHSKSTQLRCYNEIYFLFAQSKKVVTALT